MYTGIVETTGRIAASYPWGEGHGLRVTCDRFGTVDPGDSVALNGVCCTAEETGSDWLVATLSGETTSCTYLADLDRGAELNVELPVAAGDPLDGHVLKGTVDCVGELAAVDRLGTDEWRYRFRMPAGFDRYVAPKGAVGVDGVALTVADRDADGFAVAVVPETRERTTLSDADPGDPVHLEADPLARYAERLLGARAPL